MSDEKEEKAPTLTGLLWSAVNTIFKREAVMALILLLGGGGAVVLAQTRLEDSVHEKVDGGLAPIKLEQESLKRKVDALGEDMQAMKRAQEAVEQRNADRFDVLYRTILTGSPSRKAEELAKPVPILDGGR